MVCSRIKDAGLGNLQKSGLYRVEVFRYKQPSVQRSHDGHGLHIWSGRKSLLSC